MTPALWDLPLGVYLMGSGDVPTDTGHTQRVSRTSMQRTLRKPIDVVGVGLHTGKRIRMKIQPAGADAGITFVRDDIGGSLRLGPETRIARVDHATTLAGDGFVISTVEHLLAALSGMHVDNAVIRLSADEVPIMDGSAAPFVYLIKEAGLRRLAAPRRVIRLHRAVGVLDGDREVTIYPADGLKITYTIDFAHQAIGRQTITRSIGRRSFVNEIAPARTFCLLKDVQALRERGLALGGSLANAVVVGDAGPLNELRYHDEFVRHKALDVIGDLALMGHPVHGHVVASKAGHSLHARLVVELMRQKDAWSLVTPETEAGTAGAAAMAAAGARTAGSVISY